MIETLLITWREMLEAALIVGILLTYLTRTGHRDGVRYVWAGSAAALAAAAACAAASRGVLAELDPDAQELVQVAIMVVATGVLTWMVIWMRRNSVNLRGDLQRKADHALATGRLVGLATVAFVAVFREGLETVLFLWGIAVQRVGLTAVPLIGAGLVGAVLAVGTAWLFFRGFAFLDLKTFFQVTGVLLLMVSAGMLTSAVNKLIGLGYLPPLVPQLWNTSWLVRDDSPLGAVLGSFIGYRSRPSLLEVLTYVAYFPPMIWALQRLGRPAPAPAQTRKPRAAAA